MIRFEKTKRNLIKIGIGIIVILIVGTGISLATRIWDPLWNPFRPEPEEVTKETGEDEEIPMKDYRYCKPDEDPRFKLVKEKDGYYYYEGTADVYGIVVVFPYLEPQLQIWNLYFEPNGLAPQCRIVLTKEFQVDKNQLDRDFQASKIWNKVYQCEQGTGYLAGDYIIKITGFKIPKWVVDTYDPMVYPDKITLFQRLVYANYQSIVQEKEPLRVICPQIVY